ncbi:MAG TPA: CPBP family intramembrane glutamic endopeptidase [Rubrobacter sp.]|nr:CPBP family intramembrane glutamic endopeptidase [Rubrobacter sp.]
MTPIKTFIKSHPLLSYYALVFAISWGGILIVAGGPSGIPGTPEQVEALVLFALLAMFAGPPIGGIVLTGLLYGRAGLREFGSRLLKWRVGARWYAVALLTAPLSMMAALLVLSLSSREFLPGILTTGDKATLLLMGIAVGLGAGIFEELGWTGFAIPRMRLRYGVLATGLFVGVLWGAWHILANGLWASDVTSGGLSLAIFLPAYLFTFLVGQLPAFRVLMVWVYERTGSLLVAILMHGSLTASTLVLQPLAVSGMALLAVTLGYAAATWVVVAVVILAQRGRLSRQPLRKRVAQERSSPYSLAARKHAKRDIAPVRMAGHP